MSSSAPLHRFLMARVQLSFTRFPYLHFPPFENLSIPSHSSQFPPSLVPSKAANPENCRRFSTVVSATVSSGKVVEKSKTDSIQERVGEFRKRLKIVDIKGGESEGKDRLGQTLTVRGWVRTLRLESSVTYIENLYTSLYSYSYRDSHNAVTYTPDQIRNMEESMRIQKQSEPRKLI